MPNEDYSLMTAEESALLLATMSEVTHIRVIGNNTSSKRIPISEVVIPTSLAAEIALNTRLDNIIIASGTSDAETIDARGGYSLLGQRLDANDAIYPKTGLTTGYLPYKTATLLADSGLFWDGEKFEMTRPEGVNEFFRLSNQSLAGGETTSSKISFFFGVTGILTPYEGASVYAAQTDGYGSSLTFATNDNQTGDALARMYISKNGDVTVYNSLTTNGGLQTFGANDSAGAGYRIVRVPNA